MDINMSMYDFMIKHRDQTQVTAIKFFGAKVSTPKLYNDISKLASCLANLGVARGDSVAICLPNFPQAITSFYATNSIGAVANIIHPLVPPLGLKDILTRIHTKVIFIYDHFYKQYKSVLDELDIIVILCSPSEYMSQPLAIGMKIYSLTLGIKISNRVMRYSKAIKANVTKAAIVTDNGDADACYLHSGGTTGHPKTVVMSNRALNSCGHNINHLIGAELQAGDSMLMVLPLFHVFGLGVCMHSTLASNATSVLVPQFNAKKVCKIVAKNKVTYLCGVPSMYSKMMDCKEFGGVHLKSMKYCYSGGDKLKAEVITRFNEIASSYGANCHICEGYGLTEATICTVNATHNESIGSVGYGIGDCKVMIVGDDNMELPYGELGEIAVGGSSVMTRYYDDETTTNEVIFTHNGVRFVRTGDIGRMSESGHLFFIDRKKRMMKVSGINVFPSEVESVVYDTTPQVKHCAAIESSIGGKTCVKLYVVLRDNQELTDCIKDSINQSVSARLMKYSVPRIIEQRESLPLTHIGKVDYKLIIDSEAADANKE